MEQPQIHRRALGKLVKVLPGGGGVAVGLPATAAGKALAPVPDKAHHVLQRIAQKYPDLVGEIHRFRSAAQPQAELIQQGAAVRGILRQTVTSLPTTNPSSARCSRTSSLPLILRMVTVSPAFVIVKGIIAVLPFP